MSQQQTNLDNALSLSGRIKNMTGAILGTDGTERQFPQDFRRGMLEVVKESAEMLEIFISLEKKERSKEAEAVEHATKEQAPANNEIAETVAQIWMAVWFINNALSVVNEEFTGKNTRGEFFAESLASIAAGIGLDMLDTLESLDDLLGLEGCGPIADKMKFRGHLEVPAVQEEHGGSNDEEK